MDEVLTTTQNRHNTTKNCDCLTSTKVNNLIWDKLKSDTRSVDIKLQRVQSNLVKGLVPVVSVIEKLVQARDKIPKDVLDVPKLIRAANDAIAPVGAANFEPRGGGGYLTKFNTGRLSPQGPTLYPFIYHFGRIGTPFIYLLLKKDTPFTNLI